MGRPWRLPNIVAPQQRPYHKRIIESFQVFFSFLFLHTLHRDTNYSNQHWDDRTELITKFNISIHKKLEKQVLRRWILTAEKHISIWGPLQFPRNPQCCEQFLWFLPPLVQHPWIQLHEWREYSVPRHHALLTEESVYGYLAVQRQEWEVFIWCQCFLWQQPDKRKNHNLNAIDQLWQRLFYHVSSALVVHRNNIKQIMGRQTSGLNLKQPSKSSKRESIFL